MNSINKHIKNATIALALLGSATLAALGTPAAHAGPFAPTISESTWNCGLRLVGTGFTPGGKVTIIISDKYSTRTFQTFAGNGKWYIPSGAVVFYDYNLSHFGPELTFRALDVTTNKMSNTATDLMFCN